jgi:hypothetical protein
LPTICDDAGTDADADDAGQVPRRSLVGFERTFVPARGSRTIHFRPFRSRSFELVNAAGNRTLYPGLHSLVFSRGHGDEVTINVTLPFA